MSENHTAVVHSDWRGVGHVSYDLSHKNILEVARYVLVEGILKRHAVRLHVPVMRAQIE